MADSTTLTLRFRDCVLQVEQGHSCGLGRGETNNLIVPNQYASRMHATIESQKGGFVLMDHSTNGTYVQLDGQETAKVKQSRIELTGQGIISLGRDPAKDGAEPVSFEVA